MTFLLIEEFDAFTRLPSSAAPQVHSQIAPYQTHIFKGLWTDRMKTRAKGTARTAAEANEPTEVTTAKVQLGPESPNPPQLFILPEGISTDARIISLTNPRYLSEDRYVVCPERGFYEFRAIAAPKTTPRSWLLSRPEDEVPPLQSGEDTTEMNLSKGYVTRGADLFIATPIDPLFFLLPALAPESKSSGTAKRLFLSSDDYLEKTTSASPALGNFLRIEKLRGLLERRMAAVCETVEAGDETMYRLDEERLLKELLQKAKNMAERGLPASMEEKLVRKPLEAPMLSIKREESSLQESASGDVPPATSDVSTPLSETPDTQTSVSSTDSATTLSSEASTVATSFSGESTDPAPLLESKTATPQIDAPEGVADLLRLRTALDFICSNYIAPHITEKLKLMLSSTTATTDFGPLDQHLAHLTKLRQEALAARSLGDYSRKRAMNEDDEDLEARAEKKRKMEEEEKRKKAGESQGIKKLKKANISGMKKMSEFFKKK
jgi:hypothetical protein